MILVFGSINIDMVVPVPQLPLPGETVLGGDYQLEAGGKGANQALAARLAGSPVALAGAVGHDGFAETALLGLRRAGVDLALLRRVERPTGCAAIMVGGAGDNMIAVAPGANAMAMAAQVPDHRLGPRTTLLLQMEVPAGENAALIRRARAAGARIVLNLAPAAPIDGDSLAAIDLLVVNEAEAASFGGGLPELARRLRQAVVVTRGAADAQAFLSAGGRIATPALPITPLDTTGAGDAFTGVLAASLDQGIDLAAALRRAGAAAGLVCLARGAQAGLPDRAAIDRAVARLPSP